MSTDPIVQQLRYCALQLHSFAVRSRPSKEFPVHAVIHHLKQQMTLGV